MSFTANTCGEFVEKTASGDPVPGGGGVSSLVGALGAALGNMADRLLTDGLADLRAAGELREISERFDFLQRELLRLIDRDAEVAEPLIEAHYAEEEVKARTLEPALKSACAVPLAMMECICETIELLGMLSSRYGRLSPDRVGAGAIFCASALRSASLNVYTNTKFMKDRDCAESMNARADAMLEKYPSAADAIFESALKSLN